jgi:hypothetical protein
MNIFEQLDRLSSRLPSPDRQLSSAESLASSSHVLMEQAVRLYTCLRRHASVSQRAMPLAPLLSRMALAWAELTRACGVALADLPSGPPVLGDSEQWLQLGEGGQVQEGALVALLQGVADLYLLVRRDLAGTDYFQGQVYRSAILTVWRSLEALVRLLGVDLAAALEEGQAGVHGTPATASLLHRTDPTWDGGFAFLVDELVGVGNIGEYALLFVPAQWKQRAGWYALRVEPIQRALDSGLVVTRPDGWCRGFAFCEDSAHRRCETMGEAYRQVQGDARRIPR